MKVPLSRPWVTKEDIEAVGEVLMTPNLSLGPKLVDFENMLAKVAQRKYAVAVNSGTSALHLIVKSLGIKEGDEVITTPFSFIASSNSILFENAKPVFVDIRSDTYNIDPDLIEMSITDKTRAILAVDVFGQPADWDEISEIAKKYHLKLIEDSAESIGSEYRGMKAGSFGDAAIFGFYPNKQITTGEGGVVVTDREDVYKLSKSMRNQGRGEVDTWLEHMRLGYNYRIADINCALGISQLQRLDEIIEKRSQLANLYYEKLKDIEKVVTPYIAPTTTKMSWFVYVVLLNKKFNRVQRDAVIEKLAALGVESREYFSVIHLQPFYRGKFGFKKGDFPIAESISERTIALPFYTMMNEEEVDYVVDSLKKVLLEVKKG